MTGGAVFDGVAGRAGAVRPAGDLRHGLAGAARRRSQAGRLMATSRAVIGFWLVHALRRPAGCARPWRSCSTCTRPAGCAPSTAATTRWSTPGRRTRTSRSRRTPGKLVLDVRALTGLTRSAPTTDSETTRARQIDAAFTDLPLRQLADAALTRARDLGAEHADIRVERIRDSPARACTTPGWTAPATTTTSASRCGSLHRRRRGASPRDVDLTPEAAVRVAEQAVAVAQVSRPLSTERVELADEPVARRRDRGCRRTTSTRSTCRTPTRSRCSPTGAPGCWRTTSSTTPTPSLHSVQGEQVLRRPRRHHDHPAAGADQLPARGGRHRQGVRPVRHDAHARGARRPRLGVPHRRPATTGSAELAELPEHARPRSCGRPASRAAATTW